MEKQLHYRVIYSQSRYLSFAKVSRNRIHRHSFYEPCIVISGSGELEHDNDIYSLHKGDLFIANPSVYHEIRSIKSKDLQLYFFPFTLLQDVKQIDQASYGQDNKIPVNFLLHHRVHLSRQFQLIPLFEHVMTLKGMRIDESHAQIYHDASLLLLKQIMTVLADAALLSEQTYSDHIKLGKILNFIEQHLDRPFRLTELAAACGMSERTLRRKWKDWSRHTLMDEINQRRMERAAHLLLLPDISIAEVGYQIGIEDPAQFSRLFKKIRKCTPKAFRQRYQDAIPSTLPGHLPLRTEFLNGEQKEYSGKDS
jgi:AraC-like DNA-binding protein